MKLTWQIELGNSAELLATLAYVGTTEGAKRAMTKAHNQATWSTYTRLFLMTQEGRASIATYGKDR